MSRDARGTDSPAARSEASADREAGEAAGYEGPGAWGPAALTLLVVLFLLATAATVHSMIATLG